MQRPPRYVFNGRERKFPLTPDLWQSVADCAERYLPLEKFDGVHSVVSIRTTYLDTPSLTSYREYVDAKPIRRKIRIRQYGYEGEFDGNCWVEIKIKRYRDRLKRRFPCSNEKLLDFMSGTDIHGYVMESNNGSAEVSDIYVAARKLIVDRALAPVVRVDFDRLSFQDQTSPESRITIDRNLRFRTARGTQRASFDGIILEVKHGFQEPQWLESFLRDLKLQKSRRFSKFARAIKELGADQLQKRDST